MTMTTEATATTTTTTIGRPSADDEDDDDNENEEEKKNNKNNNTNTTSLLLSLFHEALLIALVTVCSSNIIGYHNEDLTELTTRIGYYYRKNTKKLNVTNDFIHIETNRILNYKTKEEKWRNKKIRSSSLLTKNDKESIIRIVFETYFDITQNTQMSLEFDTDLVEIGGYGLGMDSTDLVTIVSELMKEREKLEGRIIGSSPTTRTAAQKKPRFVDVDDVDNTTTSSTSMMMTPQPGPLFH